MTNRPKKKEKKLYVLLMVLLPYFLNEGTWIFFLHQSPDYVTGLDLI